MRAGACVIALVACILATPHKALAQCSTLADQGQKAACLQGLVELRKELTNYVTDTDLTKKHYVTDSTLEGKKYVTETGLAGKKYVTETGLESKNYVTDTGLAGALDPYAKTTTGDYFWILQAAVLVLLMQAGFLFLELGVVRRQFDKLQASYKVTALFMTYAGYVPVGFALMFGISSHGGFFGTFGFPAFVISSANVAIKSGAALEHFRSIGFFLFQAAFAATAVTIPSGAIAERMSVKGFAVASFVMAFLVYPVFGYWAWSGNIYPDDNILSAMAKSTIARSSNTAVKPASQSTPDKSSDPVRKDRVGNPPEKNSNDDLLKAELAKLKTALLPAGSVGWLQRNGFHDFAGSTVVHSVGGWFALVGALMLGPRHGRFGKNRRSFKSRSMGMATAGALFLFFGWFGFNGGSTLAYSTKVDDIVFATVIAAFAAGLSAGALALWGERRHWKHEGYVMEKALGGFLGGLVAITASCDLCTELWQPILIGVTAGIVHNIAFDLLLWFEIDDPVGAIPVHLACGIWGTAFVAILNHQYVAQGVGIVAAFAWTFPIASLLFGLLSITRKLDIGDWLFLSQLEERLLVAPNKEH